MQSVFENAKCNRFRSSKNLIKQNQLGLVDSIKGLVDENNVLLYQTEENVTDLGAPRKHFEFWDRVRSSYTKEQLLEMNDSGYSVLHSNQIELLYGPNSPYANSTKYVLTSTSSRLGRVRNRIPLDGARMGSASLECSDGLRKNLITVQQWIFGLQL